MMLSALLAGLLASTVVTLPLPPDFKAGGAVLADLDGDGARDLVLATGARGRDFERTLRIFRRRPGAVPFAPEPDRVLPVPRNVTAFAAGDVLAAPGEELVLFTESGPFAWRALTEGDQPARVLAADFLWQVPRPREVFAFPAALADLDGDGRPDFLLPEPGGYRTAQQGTGERRFALTTRLALPRAADGTEAEAEQPEGARRERYRRLRSDLLAGAEEDVESITVAQAVPVPALADFDGDGLPDVVAQSGESLLVWRQRRGAGFPEHPDLALLLPLDVDRGRRLDLSFGTHAKDLDGDGRADFLILAGDRRSRDVRTQVLVYRAAPGSAPGALFPEDGAPSQALFVSGFARVLELSDVDGNGLPDLVLGSLRADPRDAMRAMTRGDVEVDLTVYLNVAGRFAPQPALAIPVRLRDDSLRDWRDEPPARFVADVSGDGARDLLLRDEAERVRVRAVRRDGRGLALTGEDLLSLKVGKEAEVLLFDGVDPEIVVLDREQVLYGRPR
jgi:hypothetical protein